MKMHRSPLLVLAFLTLSHFAMGNIPPENDFWTMPFELAGDEVTITGSNAFASGGSPEFFGHRGVWYKWSPETAGAFEISTDGSSIDTVLAVYILTGGDFSSFYDLRNNDNRDDTTTDSTIRMKLFTGLDYRILVASADVDDAGDFNLQIRRLQTPANDTADGATVLTGDFPEILDDNTAATAAPDETGEGLWYRWTATQSATFRVTTAGSVSFTNLTVFSGTAANALTEIVYSDDAEGGSNFAASADVAMSAGTQYWFLVGNPIPTDAGPLQLSLGIPPANDSKETAINLPSASPTTTGDNRGAIRNSREFGYHGLWYTWTPPADGGYAFTTLGSEIDTLLTVYTGASADDLDRIGLNDNEFGSDTLTSRLELNLVTGQTYWIAITTPDEGDFGEFNLQINPIPAPPNDTVQMATALSGEQVAERSNINGASTDAGERGFYGVWYRWTAPQSGLYHFSTARSSFDTYLTVYSGSSASNLTELGFNDESPENPENNFLGVSSVILAVNSGTSYWILVSGADADQSGNFSLGILPVPPNDTPQTAVLMTGLDPALVDDNSGATSTSEERGVHTTWYRWTVPADREYRIQMNSTEFDTILTIFEGPDANNLVELGFNDDDFGLDFDGWGSGLTLLGETGTTYWFMASAKFEGQTGSFDIFITPGVFPQTLDEWLQTELVDFGITTRNGPSDDYDEDGLIHLVEYAFGSNPRKADSPETLRATFGFGSTALNLIYHRRIASTAPGLQYTPEFATNFSGWTQSNLRESVEQLNTVWEEVRVDLQNAPSGSFKKARVLISYDP